MKINPYIEFILEYLSVFAIIILSTLFANDLIFQTNIKEKPETFAWISIIIISLYIIIKIINKKK